MMSEPNAPKIAIDEGNEVSLSPSARLDKATIIVRGKGNALTVQDGAVLVGSKIEIRSDNNSIHIGHGVRFKGAIVCTSTGHATVKLGDRSTFGHVNIIAAEGKSILIGEDCMFSWSIEVRCTDSHPMFDIKTGERINEARDIVVGDHCWVGAKSHLLKGARVADGSVVAIGATVTKAFEEANCVLAGTPANIIRRGVRWDRTHLG